MIYNTLYKIIAVMLLVIGSLSFAYYKGKQSKEVEIQVLKATIDQKVKDAKLLTKETDDKHQKEMKDAKEQFKQDVANIAAYYKSHPVIRLLNNTGSSSAMPETTSSSKRTDGPPASVSTDTEPTITQYAIDCSTVSAELVELQRLLIQDGITVK